MDGGFAGSEPGQSSSSGIGPAVGRRWPPQPELTGLQVLVLWLLFGGGRQGRALRAEMSEGGIELSRSAFSSLMCRLERRGLVRAGFVSEAAGGQTLRYRVYEATLSGLRTWRKAVDYYQSFAEPRDASRHVLDDVAQGREDEDFAERLNDMLMRLVEARTER